MAREAPATAEAGESEAGSIAGRDLALLIGMNLIWGLNLIASKIGVAQLPPVFFTALRFLAIGLLLIPFLRIHRGQMKNLLAAAIFTGPLTFALLFVGLFLVADASMVAIASQMGVPFSTLLSVWLLGETIYWRRRLGIALAFGGIALIGFDPRAFAYAEGLTLVVLSCFIGSLGLIFVKRLHDIKALELQAWIGLVGGPTLLVFSLMTETNQLQATLSADWRAWAALSFTTVMSSLIAHTGWYYLVSRYPVTSLSPVTLLSPLFGVFFGVTLLHDQLTWRMMLGGAITLLGVLIVLIREKRLIDTGT
jgi:O-acetylserine/cysteine efflux transporter